MNIIKMSFYFQNALIPNNAAVAVLIILKCGLDNFSFRPDVYVHG